MMQPCGTVLQENDIKHRVYCSNVLHDQKHETHLSMRLWGKEGAEEEKEESRATNGRPGN